MKKLILSAGGALCLIFVNQALWAAESTALGEDRQTVSAVSDVFQQPVFEHEVQGDQQAWSLTVGPLKEQLEQWSDESNTWNVIWYGDADLLVDVPHTFNSDLDQAVKDVVKAYAREGADIRLKVATANQQLVIQHWGQ